MKNKKLHNIKSAGFKTPRGYFESIDEKIFSKLNTKSSLNSTKETGFKVPNSYFETFNDKVLANKESKVIQLFSNRSLIYISSIAAAILLLINLSLFDNQPTFDDLKTETVENYIIEEHMTSYEIAALFSDEKIEEDMSIELNLTEDNIEAYLLNNADIEILMIE